MHKHTADIREYGVVGAVRGPVLGVFSRLRETEKLDGEGER